MFSPIKKFITYIQRNASNSPLFRLNSTPAIEDKKLELPSSASDSNSLEKKQKSSVNCIVTNNESNPEFDEDDIETQIKSIMLKKPVRGISNDDSYMCDDHDSLSIDSSSSFLNTTQSQFIVDSRVSIDDELADFRDDPTEIGKENLLNIATCRVDHTNSDVNEEDLQHVESEAEAANDEHSNPVEAEDENDQHLISIQADADDGEHLNPVKAEAENTEHLNPVKAEAENTEHLNPIKAEAESTEQLNTVKAEAETDVHLNPVKNETRTNVYLIQVDIHHQQSDYNSIMDNCDEHLLHFESNQPFYSTASNDFSNGEFIVANDANLTMALFPEAAACVDPLAIDKDEHATLDELNILNSSAIVTTDDEETNVTATEDDLEWFDNETKCDNKKLSGISILGEMVEPTIAVDERGDGSDSGLGSETSALHTTTLNIAENCQLSMNNSSISIELPESLIDEKSEEIIGDCILDDKDILAVAELSVTKATSMPKRSNLKRRLEINTDTDIDVDGVNHNLVKNSAGVQKKLKRSINFDMVEIYYFPRQQGFSCVPSVGGCTLGMGAQHIDFKAMTLAEHAAELRRAHRLQSQEINPRGFSSDDSEESDEEYLSEGSGSDIDADLSGFLQPVSPKQRRALLKAAGVRKIDPSEKIDCRNIRNSREICGCSCRNFCDPETCSCSLSGIKCQVDRDMFPCGCSRDACSNVMGRIEFNPSRVRIHFMHTLMRLQMESGGGGGQQTQANLYNVNTPNLDAITGVSSTVTSFYHHHNYSSDYNSPAYNTMEQHQQTAVDGLYYQSNDSMAANLYGQQSGTLGIQQNDETLSVTAITAGSYNIDTLDSVIYTDTTSLATPTYDDLIAVTSYHNVNYLNAATQCSSYNAYHNTTYMNSNGTHFSIPTTYSSCSLPTDPPLGTATTTESSSGYSLIDQLGNLETTIAPSCSMPNEHPADKSSVANPPELHSSNQIVTLFI